MVQPGEPIPMNENTNTESYNNDIARLYWQCRRGMLELDFLLQNFLDENIEKLSKKEVDTFKKLLKHPDNLLLEYLMGRTIPMDKDIANVVDRIRKTPCN